MKKFPRSPKRYSAIKTRIFLFDAGLTVIALGLFQTQLSFPLARGAATLFANFYLTLFVYAAVFMAFMYIIEFPLRFLSSFHIEHRFDLSEQRFLPWLADEAKSAGVAFVISMLAIETFYFLLRNYPDKWWMMAAVAWIFFSIVLARLAPLIIIPLFFKYIPIEDKNLKKRLTALGTKARVRITDICKIDFSKKTKKANAAIVGLGKSRKVILADTLVNEFTPDEIESVTAHEFGHHKYKHIWQLIAFSGGLTLIGLFILSRVLQLLPGLLGAWDVLDLGIFPAIAFCCVLFSLVIMPLSNFFSRILERQADRFALAVTGNTGAFVSLMEKLASMNLADTEPSLAKKIFFYDHPPIGERIRAARNQNG